MDSREKEREELETLITCRVANILKETNKNFVILKVGAFPLHPNTDGKDSVQRDSVCLLSTGQCMFIQVTRKKQEVKKLILGYKIV